jgi:hypothetical protein
MLCNFYPAIGRLIGQFVDSGAGNSRPTAISTTQIYMKVAERRMNGTQVYPSEGLANG